MTVYVITNKVNGKMYVGQTVKTYQERWQGHLQALRTGWKTHLYNAMRKYGPGNFEIRPIAEVYDQETLDLLEDFFINYYDSMNNGYNMMGGGRNNPMDYEKSEASHDEKMRTDEVRGKISSTLKKYYKENHDSEKEIEHRRKLSAQKSAMYASEKGDEVRRKFRESFKLSPEHDMALRRSKYKPVYCVDETGKVINSFECMRDAAIWWYENSERFKNVRDYIGVVDYLTKSCKQGVYIAGLRWYYGTPENSTSCGEAIES